MKFDHNGALSYTSKNFFAPLSIIQSTCKQSYRIQIPLFFNLMQQSYIYFFCFISQWIRVQTTPARMQEHVQ